MNQQAAAEHRSHLREYWLNHRRIRFWIVVFLLLYTVAGFLGLPWLLRTQAIETMSSDFDRELRIADVHVNPYALTLQIDGLELDDRDGELLARFDRLLVDFTLLSLFNWAWTFEAVELDGLSLRAERFESGETRLLRLVEELAAPDPAAEDSPGDGKEDAGPPRVVVEQLRLEDGHLRFLDRVPADEVEITLQPVDIDISRIDTRPDREGSQSVHVELESGGSLDWQGTLQMVPFLAEGRVELSDVVADGMLPYLRQAIPLTDLRLVFDTSFDYRVSLPADGPAFRVDNLQAEFRELSLSAFEPETEFLGAEAVRIESASYRHPEQTLAMEAVHVDQPRVETWLSETGEPGLLRLLPTETGADSAEEPAAPANPLSMEIARLRVNGLDVDLADRSTTPPAPIGLRGVDIELDAFDLESGSRFPTRVNAGLATGGRLSFNGSTRIAPAFDLQGDLRVSALDLALAEPYLAQVARARFASGAIDLDGRLSIGPDEPLAYNGKAGLEQLDVVTADGGERVLGWESLRIDALQLGLGARRVETSLVSIDKPFARVAIAEDQSTNIGRLLVDSPGADAPDTDDEPGEPFSVRIDGIAVSGGSMDFSDRSLPLPFATDVKALGGRISTLASDTTEPADITLEGQVGAYGLARIDGSINTWEPTRHTDIRVEFRNLEMPDYSPYTVQFAGRRIATGRMDLDLAYAIDEGLLQGSNDIVLRDLELGEAVDSPDAADLPLGLAVALLKDSNGVIDIDLPVSGDVNDPQFEIGGVVRQALVTLITKIVTSPFNLLASLVGVDSEDFGRIEFLAGRSDLTPPQREQIGKLVEALEKRPELVLEVAGAYDAGLDRPALQKIRTLAQVRERIGETDDVDTATLSLSDEAAREPLRSLFREAYPGTDLDAVREQFRRVPEDDAEAEPQLDIVAFHAHLAREVAAAQDIGSADLEALASARVDSIRAALTGGGDDSPQGLKAERVRIADPVEVDSDSDTRVPLEIELAVD